MTEQFDQHPVGGGLYDASALAGQNRLEHRKQGVTIERSFRGQGNGPGDIRPRQTYNTGQRNDQRNASYWNVDLKATKELRLGRSMNLQLSAEIFNLLDDGTYQVYNPFLERGIQINGVNEARQRFGRSWQLGMRLSF